MSAAPAQAQGDPGPPTNFSVTALTGVATWDAKNGVGGFKVKLQVGSEDGVTVELSAGASATSLNLTTASICCLTNEWYRAQIKTTWTNFPDSDWSDWEEFAYTGSDVFTATATVSPPVASWGMSGTLQLPVYNANDDRIYFKVEANKPFAGTCSIVDQAQLGTIACPGTLVSLAAPAACGNYTAQAVLESGSETSTGESVTLTGTVRKPCPAATETQYWANLTPTAPATATSPPPPVFIDPPPGQQDSPPRFSGAAKPATAVPIATIPRLPTQDHSQLPAGAEVESDSPWIAFREVSGDAISNAAVREAALSAIDVMGPLGVDAEICFAGAGSLLLLDTAYSPRRLVWLNAWQRPDGKTCAHLDRAGTVALMPAALTPTPTSLPASTATPNPYLVADSPDSARALDDCIVAANELLNFRRQPAGPILSLYMGASQAIARTDNWFQVRYLGNEGWISAHYVATDGDCG